MTEKLTRLQEAKRNQQVIRLHEAGATYREIEDELGVPKSTAHDIVQAHIKELKEYGLESVDRARSVDLERLDRLLMGLWNAATSGHLGAVEKALRIMERRAKLLGMDAIQLPDGVLPNLQAADLDALLKRRSEILAGTSDDKPGTNGTGRNGSEVASD